MPAWRQWRLRRCSNKLRGLLASSAFYPFPAPRRSLPAMLATPTPALKQFIPLPVPPDDRDAASSWSKPDAGSAGSQQFNTMSSVHRE